MRRSGKIDRNQPEIVAALRSVGCSVQILSAVGRGVPDLLVGYRSHNLLLEIKDGLAAKSDRKLTPDQVKWHRDWQGIVYVVESKEQALDVLRMIP